MRYQILAEEKIEYKTSERLIHGFINDWNDRNPEHKLDNNIIELLSDYLKIAYVAGWDDFRFLIEDRLKNFDPNCPNINKHFLQSCINEFNKII